MLADDAEARGAREEAAARHEDRIKAATEAAAALEGENSSSANGVDSHVYVFYAIEFRVVRHLAVYLPVDAF